MTSPPSGCQGDFHPRAVEHARHTNVAHGASRGRIAKLTKPRRKNVLTSPSGGYAGCSPVPRLAPWATPFRPDGLEKRLEYRLRLDSCDSLRNRRIRHFHVARPLSATPARLIPESGKPRARDRRPRGARRRALGRGCLAPKSPRNHRASGSAHARSPGARAAVEPTAPALASPGTRKATPRGQSYPGWP